MHYVDYIYISQVQLKSTHLYLHQWNVIERDVICFKIVLLYRMEHSWGMIDIYIFFSPSRKIAWRVQFCTSLYDLWVDCTLTNCMPGKVSTQHYRQHYNFIPQLSSSLTNSSWKSLLQNKTWVIQRQVIFSRFLLRFQLVIFLQILFLDNFNPELRQVVFFLKRDSG